MLNLAIRIVKVFRKRDRWFLVGLMILIALSTTIEMAGISVFLPLVQIILDPAAAREVPLIRNALIMLADDDVEKFARIFGLGIFLFFVVKNLVLSGISYIQNRFVQFKLAEYTRDLLNSYLTLPYVFHLTRNSAELIKNVKISAPQVFARGILALLQLSMDAMTVAGILLLLLYIDPMTTIGLSVLLGGSMAIYYSLIHHRMLAWSQMALRHNGRTFVWLNQALGAIKETKLSGRSQFFVDTFGRESIEQAHYETLLVTIPQWPRMIIETVAVGGVMFLIFIVIQPRGSTIDALPVMGAFAFAALRIMPALSRLMSSLTLLRGSAAALDEVYDDLVRVSELYHVIPAGQPLQMKHSIVLENVSFFYPDGRNALRDISMTISAGESVAFVGRSGAGKTTAVDIILGLLAPTSGRILIDGNDITKQPESWQRNMGYIPQTVYLIDDTIRRNIALGYPDAEIDAVRLEAVIDMAHMSEVVSNLPDGLDTIVGERGTRLSGGQRQRIAIARALYGDPDILVMDEATAALDNETEREISRAISELSGRTTLIIIAHRLSTVKACDRLYLFENGQIVDSGSYDTLLDRNVNFRQMALV
jgi:ABC-type multidrug transport system fused ATPase/permease subunit